MINDDDDDGDQEENSDGQVIHEGKAAILGFQFSGRYFVENRTLFDFGWGAVLLKKLTG